MKKLLVLFDAMLQVVRADLSDVHHISVVHGLIILNGTRISGLNLVGHFLCMGFSVFVFRLYFLDVFSDMSNSQLSNLVACGHVLVHRMELAIHVLIVCITALQT